MPAGVVGVGTTSRAAIVVMGALSSLASVFGGLSTMVAVAVVVDGGSGGHIITNIIGI